MHASQEGHAATVELLLANGADPIIQNKVVNVYLDLLLLPVSIDSHHLYGFL